MGLFGHPKEINDLAVSYIGPFIGRHWTELFQARDHVRQLGAVHLSVTGALRQMPVITHTTSTPRVA